MTTEAKKLLWDIAEAIDAIAQFTSGFDAAKYAATLLVRSAVERQFEIMGEAAIRLRRDEAEVFALLPTLRDVIAFRNFLSHVYDAVDAAKVWAIVEVDLPPLRKSIGSLFGENAG